MALDIPHTLPHLHITTAHAAWRNTSPQRTHPRLAESHCPKLPPTRSTTHTTVPLRTSSAPGSTAPTGTRHGPMQIFNVGMPLNPYIDDDDDDVDDIASVRPFG